MEQELQVQPLVLTTCANAQQSSACLWDPATGNALHYYKNGGVIAPNSLNLIGKDYLLSGDDEKPMIHIWPLNSQEPEKKLSTILPEKASVITLCPKSNYLAAGLGTKLYIWQLATGKLLTIQKRNFQPVTCIKFSSNGAFVVIGGEDGMLIVYLLANLVSLHNNLHSQSEGQVDPLYTKNDHLSSISGIHVGCNSTVVTVSPDNTCKMYDLGTGNLLLNLVFEGALSAVVLDGPCWNLYVGQNSGKIHKIILKELPKSVEHVTGNVVFSEHKKRVTCLDLGELNGVLVSGSEDMVVIIWNILTGEALRRLEHKGYITNVKCLLSHENFFIQNLKFKCDIQQLNRDFIQFDDFTINTIDDCEVELSEDEVFTISERSTRSGDAEIAKLRCVNQQLFAAASKISRRYNDF